MPLMSFHTQAYVRADAGQMTLLPTDHGPGDPAIAGALRVLLERLVQSGGAIAPSLQTGYVVPFDPESFKLVALDLLDEATGWRRALGIHQHPHLPLRATRAAPDCTWRRTPFCCLYQVGMAARLRRQPEMRASGK